MLQPGCDLQMSHQSHHDSYMKWHGPVLVSEYAPLLLSFISWGLGDMCHPGTAGRWGCPPVHLSGSFSPRTGPRCPAEARRCCDSTRSLWYPADHAHEQRWPAERTAGLSLLIKQMFTVCNLLSNLFDTVAPLRVSSLSRIRIEASWRVTGVWYHFLKRNCRSWICHFRLHCFLVALVRC